GAPGRTEAAVVERGREPQAVAGPGVVGVILGPGDDRAARRGLADRRDVGPVDQQPRTGGDDLRLAPLVVGGGEAGELQGRLAEVADPRELDLFAVDAQA